MWWPRRGFIGARAFLAPGTLLALFFGRPVTLSQKRIDLSSEPVARVLLSGLQVTQLTPARWPTRVSMWAPVAAFQRRTVPSAEALAIQRASGDMRTWEMGPVWPRRVRVGRNEVRTG